MRRDRNGGSVSTDGGISVLCREAPTGGTAIVLSEFIAKMQTLQGSTSMRERVHHIVTRWMRAVMQEKSWSASDWAHAAGLHPSAISRIVHPPEGAEPLIPTTLTLAQLAIAAGSQPDLI